MEQETLFVAQYENIHIEVASNLNVPNPINKYKDFIIFHNDFAECNNIIDLKLNTMLDVFVFKMTFECDYELYSSLVDKLKYEKSMYDLDKTTQYQIISSLNKHYQWHYFDIQADSNGIYNTFVSTLSGDKGIFAIKKDAMDAMQFAASFYDFLSDMRKYHSRKNNTLKIYEDYKLIITHDFN